MKFLLSTPPPIFALPAWVNFVASLVCFQNDKAGWGLWFLLVSSIGLLLTVVSHIYQQKEEAEEEINEEINDQINQ